jgi:peptide/nickel transport system permease protein
MARYAIVRFGIFLLTIVVAITVNFIIIHATPADPIAAMLGRMMTRGSSVAGGAQIVQVYTEAFALDQPLYVQYLLYLRNLLTGDLGYSLAYFPQKVTSVVLRAVPWSAGLLLFIGSCRDSSTSL